MTQTYDPVICYFDRDGSVRCEECLSTPARTNSMWDGVEPTRIYAENLSPYRQDCHNCGLIVFQGTSNVILFDRDPNRILLPVYKRPEVSK